MKYLGVDYGKRKVGLAVSEGELASPLRVIEVSSLNDAVQKLTRVIKEEEIDQVVIGEPESGSVKKMVGELVGLLRPIVKIVVVPETLSTQQAVKTRITIGFKRKQRSVEDALSASIILQDYLDSNRQ